MKIQNPEIEKGSEIEREHDGTLKWFARQIKPDLDLDTIQPILKAAFEKIAEDHVQEISDYYTRLIEMERAAEGSAFREKVLNAYKVR